MAHAISFGAARQRVAVQGIKPAQLELVSRILTDAWVRKPGFGIREARPVRVLGIIEGWVVSRCHGSAPGLCHVSDWEREHAPAAAAPFVAPPGEDEHPTGRVQRACPGCGVTFETSADDPDGATCGKPECARG